MIVFFGLVYIISLLLMIGIWKIMKQNMGRAFDHHKDWCHIFVWCPVLNTAAIILLIIQTIRNL